MWLAVEASGGPFLARKGIRRLLLDYNEACDHFSNDIGQPQIGPSQPPEVEAAAGALLR